MDKYLFAGLLLLLATSCGLAENNEIEQPPSTTFSFVKIEYKDGEDCRYYFGEERLGPFDRFNVSAEPFTFVFDHHVKVYERCLFLSIAQDAFSLTDDSLKIKVPVAKAADGTLIYDKGEKWFYRKELQKFSPAFEPVGPISVEPFQRVAMVPVYSTQTISTAYKLYLRGDQMGEERIIPGFIEHTTFIDFDLRITRKHVDHIDTLRSAHSL